MRKNLKLILVILLVFYTFGLLYPVDDGTTAANTHPVYKQLREIQLNGTVIDVENFVLKRDVSVFTFKKGSFYLFKSVENRCTGAVFIGDGQFGMTPLLKEEQQHLKILTKTSSMDENFSKAVFRFSDKTCQEIKAAGKERTASSFSKAEGFFHSTRKLLRKGKAFMKPNRATALLNYNIDLRLLQDILWSTDETSPGPGVSDQKIPGAYSNGFFHAFFDGKKYGLMLFVVDPTGVPTVMPEQVVLAGMSNKNLGIWSAAYLQEHHHRKITGKVDTRLIDALDYNIDMNTREEFLEARVTLHFQARVSGARVIPFRLFPTLRVTQVEDETSYPKASAGAGSQSHGVLAVVREKKKEGPDLGIIFPEGLVKGQKYTVSIEYAGEKAVLAMGGGNFTLLARTNWYPVHHLWDRALYRGVMKTPLKLVAIPTGEIVSQKKEGKQIVTKWKCDVPLVTAGFNYGKFKQSIVKAEELDVTIESFANMGLPDMLEGFRLRNVSLGVHNPEKFMKKVRAEARIGLSIYHDVFGPMCFDRIAISQQPFLNFGQAWPMLVYMPLSAYMPKGPNQYMYGASVAQKHFLHLLCSHEVGHQWWGHTVSDKSYRSQWLMESLAQLSASFFVNAVYKEKRFLSFWKDRRENALKKNSMRKSPARVGSLSLGYRLNTARTGNVGQAAIYSKGAFVIHMLRMMMWHPKDHDARFSTMLKELVKTYFLGKIDTADFKAMVEKHMIKQMDLDGNGRMDWFFDQWVHGTLIPQYKLKYRVEKGANGKHVLFCSITQSNVDENFKMLVPIYLKYGKGIARLGSVKVKGNGSTQEIKIPLAKKPDSVLLNHYEDILCTK
ncbi:MAG: M1 family metallopeptidase [bacterium]|nr:M1 family metallopeptidase [bacterium]